MRGRGQTQIQTDGILYGRTPAREQRKIQAPPKRPKAEDLERTVLSENVLDAWAIDEEDGVVNAYSAGDVLGPFPDYDAALEYLISHEVDIDVERIGNVTISQDDYQSYSLCALIKGPDGEEEEESVGPYDTLRQARVAATQIALSCAINEYEAANPS